MKKYLLILLIGALLGCFGKSNSPGPKRDEPLELSTEIDTTCTTCNPGNPIIVVKDSSERLDICTIAFGQPDHIAPYSPVTQNFRQSLYNFLRSSSYFYDYNLMMYLGSRDSTIYCYRQGIYTPDTPLSIMSASKVVTASVIMTLVEDGKLSLDDRVSKYIPSFKSPEKERITIRQLMAHTSGIIIDSPYDQRNNMTLEQAVDSIALRTKLLFIPGTLSIYGSCAFKIASRVAEVIEKKSWAQIFHERIGSKCELGSMTYSPDNIQNPATGSGVICTMSEYLRFLNMFYNKGTYRGTRVLKAESIDIMEADNSGSIDPSHGLGLFRDDIVNGKAVEISFPAASGVHAWINRKKNFYGLIFTQAGFNKTIDSNLGFRKLVNSQIN